MTLPTDPQTIFDQAVRGLAKQGRQSINYGICRYRSPNGDKCALGMIIPDDRYNELIEGNGPHHLEFKRAFPEWEGMTEFLGALQAAHDKTKIHSNCTFRDVWGFNGVADRFTAVAMSYNLNPAIVEECWPKEDY